MNAAFLAKVPEWVARIQRAQCPATDDVTLPLAEQKHFRNSQRAARTPQLNDAQWNALCAILEKENQPLYRYVEMAQVPAQRIPARELTLEQLISGALDYFICEYVAEQMK